MKKEGLKEKITLLAIIMMENTFLSCAGRHASSDDQKYAYELNGNYYSLKIVNGIISDTSFIFKRSGELIEKSTWTYTDSSGKIIFHQKIFNGKNESIANASDSVKRGTESMLATIRKKTPDLHRIYNKYLRENPGFNGRLNFKFWIKPTGEINKLLILENTTGNKEFAIEILQKVSNWTFEAVAGQDEEILAIPFTFSE